MKRYIVIGASAAGISGAKTLREIDKDAEIILVSKDTHVYSRCILHHYISGHRTVEKLDFTTKDFFKNNNIKWLKGLEVLDVDSKEHTVSLSNGEVLNYDKLLICSGASSFIPPVENLRTANNVIGLRNLDDAEKIKEALRTLFENDASSARPDGSMEVVKVYWWKHNCPMGQYSSAKVHRLLKIEKKTEFPKNIDDYEITLDSLPGLEVEIIEGI